MNYGYLRQIKPFQPSVDDWTIYQDKLKFYFSANGIVDDTKKCAILLTVCGDPAYKLLCSMVPNGELDADGITYTNHSGVIMQVILCM